MTDNQQQGKPQEQERGEPKWKNKFRDWLVNNLQFTSKSNVERIIDHVERYIVPASSIPTEVQKEEWISINERPLIKEGEDCLILFDTGEVRRYMEEDLPAELITHVAHFPKLPISSAPPISHKEDEGQKCTAKNCKEPAVGDYNGHGSYACEYHMRKWNDEFDEDYK